MYIESLRLHDFRSYRQVMLTPPRGTTVFVGENGTGKTNLLEAVHLCCLGRSHRTSNDREMIRSGAETCAVQVRVQRGDGADTVGVRLFMPTEKKRKVLHINGKTASRTGELMGHVTCVMFSPEDIELMRGAPQGRRRFLDMLLSQCGAGYFYALQNYNSALKQRNALLHAIATTYANNIYLLNLHHKTWLTYGDSQGWIGFDTCHAGDAWLDDHDNTSTLRPVVPYMKPNDNGTEYVANDDNIDIMQPITNTMMGNITTVWNEQEVIAECKRIIDILRLGLAYKN